MMNSRLLPDLADASGAGAPIPGRRERSLAERLDDPSLPIEERLEQVTSCVLCGSSELEDVDPAAWVRACSRCGHVFRSPRPTPEAVRAFQSRATRYRFRSDRSTRRAELSTARSISPTSRCRAFAR